jgi:hypothetical protein
MQLLKISFILAIAISLCSFAYMTAFEEGKEQLYKEFLEEFKEVNIPNTITLKGGESRLNRLVARENIKKPEGQTKIIEKEVVVVAVDHHILGSKYGTFISGIDRGMMSRMGPTTYEAEVMVASTDGYNAVIYSESRSFDLSSKSFYLATYDKRGNQVDSKYLGRAGHDSFVEFAVTKKMGLTIKEMMSKLGSDGYEENNTKKMFVTSKGEILVHNNNEEIKSPTKQSKKKILSIG